MFGIKWVLAGKVLDLLCGWQSREANIWILVPSCLMWTIWRKRNWHTFEHVDCASTQLQAFIISSLYEWSLVSCLTDSNYVPSFVKSIQCRYFLNCNSLGYFVYLSMKLSHYHLYNKKYFLHYFYHWMAFLSGHSFYNTVEILIFIIFVNLWCLLGT